MRSQHWTFLRDVIRNPEQSGYKTMEDLKKIIERQVKEQNDFLERYDL